MASSTLVPKESLTSRVSPAGRPHRPTEPRVALSSQIDVTNVLIERSFAAYERDNSQQLFNHVAVLQGSAFPVVSEDLRDGSASEYSAYLKRQSMKLHHPCDFCFQA
jgi:hypothetical protein